MIIITNLMNIGLCLIALTFTNAKLGDDSKEIISSRNTGKKYRLLREPIIRNRVLLVKDTDDGDDTVISNVFDAITAAPTPAPTKQIGLAVEEDDDRGGSDVNDATGTNNYSFPKAEGGSSGGDDGADDGADDGSSGGDDGGDDGADDGSSGGDDGGDDGADDGSSGGDDGGDDGADDGSSGGDDGGDDGADDGGNDGSSGGDDGGDDGADDGSYGGDDGADDGADDD